jgi:hypothetical protein
MFLLFCLFIGARCRALVSYVYYYNSNSTDPDYDNLEFFLTHAAIQSSTVDVDFVFSVIGNSSVTPLLQELAPLQNVLVIENDVNRGTDLCTHCHTLSKYKKPRHDIFVFLNSGVRGPFLRVAASNALDWLSVFANKLSANV